VIFEMVSPHVITVSWLFDKLMDCLVEMHALQTHKGVLSLVRMQLVQYDVSIFM